jgi:endonuclease/exonuclease/phosphatase family metal-dependent hydrolase
MTIATKKTLGIVGVLSGLFYLSQNYTLSGLQHLRLERINTPTSTNQPGGWSVADRASLIRPSVPSNSSVGFPTSSQSLHGNVAQPTPAFPSLTVTPPPTATSIHSQPTTLPISTSHLPLQAKPIRIASFNLHLFGQHKAENPFVIETVAKILRQYDVIALQEICTKQQDLLPLLIERINQSDRQFDYVIGPRVGRTDNKEQFAFVFDTSTLETDRTQLYSVDDPEDLLAREPLVGWFRSKAVSAQTAFTFTLVNVHLDSDLTDKELRVLPELVRSIQVDGRKEDDIMIIGDLGASDSRMQFVRSAGMIFALEGVPTTSHGNAMLDNIIMPIKATDEYNGRSGIFDFLRQYNLSIEQAHQVSDHVPVWAEFTAYEGGQPGRVQ